MSIFTLKLIALVSMVIDHIGEFIPGTPVCLRWVGRLAAPIFLFCAAEGWSHTKSLRRYLLRLYIAGAAMGVIQYYLEIDNNFFRQLFAMCCLLGLIDLGKAHDGRFKKYLLLYVLWQAAALLIILFLPDALPFMNYTNTQEYLLPALTGSLLFVEGGLIYALLGVVIYLTRGSRRKLAVGYTISWGAMSLLLCTGFASLALGVLNRIEYQLFGVFGFGSDILDTILYFLGISPMMTGGSLLYQSYQWMLILALPLLLAYNGKKGRGMKYFFYLFYPAHILLFYWLGTVMG